MSKNILFVLEGSWTEPRLLKRIVESMGLGMEYKVFCYNTNIHAMLDGMFVDDDIDEDLDFQEYLRSCRTGNDEGHILDESFSDIFLMFDMDPHDHRYDPKRLTKAAEYFDDSTDNGKLYINYPMVESFKHVSNLYDLSYLETRVDSNGIRSYKQLVGRDGLASLSDIAKIDDSTMMRLIELNLMKANMLVTGGRGVPSPDCYRDNLTQEIILSKQLAHYSNEGQLHVLNTSLFIAIDYNAERFFERMLKM